jgi:hypothetical protein
MLLLSHQNHNYGLMGSYFLHDDITMGKIVILPVVLYLEMAKANKQSMLKNNYGERKTKDKKKLYEL